jgi:DNA-binding response OmpR family regulator
VLVVEPGPVSREALCGRLSAYGHTVAAGADLAAACAACAGGTPVLAIVPFAADAPGAVRSAVSAPDLPVLVTVPITRQIDAGRLASAGADGTLIRPFRWGQVAEALARLGGRRAAHPGTVLLVEDDAVGAMLVRRVIEASGHQVVVERTVDGALKRIACGGVDLALIDLLLADGDGIDLARRIRSSGSTLPLIAVTGRDEDRDRAACRDAGMNGFLAKPFAISELADVVRHHLERPV